MLGPEVEARHLTSELADALTGTRKDRKRFRRAGKGRQTSRARKNQLEAGFDLLQALETADGATTREVVHARAEIARLQGDLQPAPH